MSLSDCAIEYLPRIRLTRCRRNSPFLSSSGTVVGISPVGAHVLDDLTKLQGQAGILDHGERSFRLVVLPKVAFAACCYLALCTTGFNAPPAGPWGHPEGGSQPHDRHGHRRGARVDRCWAHPSYRLGRSVRRTCRLHLRRSHSGGNRYCRCATRRWHRPRLGTPSVFPHRGHRRCVLCGRVQPPGGVSDSTQAIIQSIAAGALLVVVINEMIPIAVRSVKGWAGFYGAARFVLSAILTWASGG